jgi:hypothetical protein
MAEDGSVARAEELRAAARRIARRLPFLVDVYRSVRQPRREAELLRDFAESCVRWRHVRNLPAPQTTSPAVLTVFRDDIFDAKMLALVGISLRLAGRRVVVKLPTRRLRRAVRFFSALQLGELIYDEDVELDGSVEQEARDLAVASAGVREFSTWRDLRVGSYHAGPLLLSTVIRETENGDPKDGDVDFYDRVARRVADVVRAYRRSERQLDALQPQLVVVQEPGYDICGPLIDVAVARGVDVVHAATSWRDDALLLKRVTQQKRRTLPQTVEREVVDAEAAGWSAANDAAVVRAFEQRYGGTWALQSTFQASSMGDASDADVHAALDARGRKVAVVFAHVLWDATFWAGDDLYRNYADWLVNVVRVAIATPDVKWIIKTHPANMYRFSSGDVRERCAEMKLISANFSRLPEHVQVLPPDTRLSSLQLYGAADIGLTVRGSPGFEMACFGKPVLTAGTGAYVGYGFTMDSSSVGEYEKRLRAAATLTPLDATSQARARAYALALFERRPWRLQSFGMHFRLGGKRRALDRNISPRIESLDELLQAEDLHRAGQWMTKSNSIDYLENPQ